MKRVILDTAQIGVREFIQSLPDDQEGIELELNGRIIGTLVPPDTLRSRDAMAILSRGRELVKRARDRSRDVPASVIEREVREAVREVRGREQR